ncbi:MAG: glycosyltransferase family 2 protein [Hyphomicrobiaceae bacterium]
MTPRSTTTPLDTDTAGDVCKDRITSCPITVVIAARNEAQNIEACITSVLANEGLDGPVDVIVVDGNSTDDTSDIVKALAQKSPRIRLMNNPAGYAPHAFNIGIRNALGRHVMILSGHSKLSRHHLAACVDVLDKGQADIAGGVTQTLPGQETEEAHAVWLAMTHPLGFGASKFRQGVDVPTEVDTVAFGAMHGDLFAKVGLFDEDLIRGQDDEFNARVRRNGGRILLLPELSCAYFARTTISQLYRMCYQYGAFKPISNIKAGNLISLRQFAPSSMLLSFVAGLLISLIWGWAILLPVTIALCYLVLSLHRARKLKNGISLPGVWLILKSFIAAHSGYGLGFLHGIYAVIRYGKTAAKRLARSQSLVRLSR